MSSVLSAFQMLREILKVLLLWAAVIIAVVAAIPRLFQPVRLGDGSLFVVMNFAPARIMSTAR